MKNRKHGKLEDSVTLPLPVPDGTKSGDIVILGTAGLYGVATTDKITTAIINAGGNVPQGYVDGQGGVFLPGISITLAVANTALTAFATFAKVYKSAAGAYTATTTDTFVGYKINPTTLALRGN